MGHAFRVTYGSVVSLLASVADPSFKVLPDPKAWHQSLVALQDAREEGYYYGSPVSVVPVGVLEIMEGQARFAQMQYLHFASRATVDWDSFRAIGMLESGVYRAAFDLFLTLAELDWPERVDHPTVGLFLLICDMALNPGACFPFGLTFPSAFIDDVDPGMRFISLARSVKTQCPDVAGMIQTYSREEYIAASKALAKSMLIDPPLAIAEEIASWPSRSSSVQALMEQYETYDFDPSNQPVRLLFSHAIAFAIDKAQRPEVFCWPGAWMAGTRVSVEIAALFEKHGALFVDKADDDGVFPRLRPDRDPGLVQKSFERFYSTNVTYDMTRQWITTGGPFSYNYGWLVQNADALEIKEFVDQAFSSVYGISPDEIEVVD